MPLYAFLNKAILTHKRKFWSKNLIQCHFKNLENSIYTDLLYGQTKIITHKVRAVHYCCFEVTCIQILVKIEISMKVDMYTGRFMLHIIISSNDFLSRKEYS